MHQKEEHPTDLWNIIQIKTTDQPQHNSSGWFPCLILTNRQFTWGKKLDREAVELNEIINQMDLAGIYSIFHSNGREYTFSPAAVGIFFKIGCVLGHKARPSKIRELGITSWNQMQENWNHVLQSTWQPFINDVYQQQKAGRWTKHEETNWVEQEIKREI